MFPVCGRGENRRSLVYVDDLVDALVRAELREGVSGRAYWIADARPYSMNEILESVRRALHDAGVPVRPQRLRLPRFAASVALAGDRVLQATGRYSQQLHVLSEMDKTIACRIDRARDELKYEPSVGLDEGMRRSVAWCIERGITL
jgi:nucleoside-diphosphate-sugar epimerase